MGGCEEPQSGGSLSLHSKFSVGGGWLHSACVSEHTVLKKKKKNKSLCCNLDLHVG